MATTSTHSNPRLSAICSAFMKATDAIKSHPSLNTLIFDLSKKDEILKFCQDRNLNGLVFGSVRGSFGIIHVMDSQTNLSLDVDKLKGTLAYFGDGSSMIFLCTEATGIYLSLYLV